MEATTTTAAPATSSASESSVAQLPPLVRSFCAYFTRYVDENNVTELSSIYENSFNKLTERFFKSSPWPEVTVVLPLLGTNPLTRLLYKELYYRHIYSRLTPSLQDRIDSWNNYLELFKLILETAPKSAATRPFRLPHAWLFDMIDEFVWQAQSFNHYRLKLKTLSAADKAALAKMAPNSVWNIVTVLRTLERVVEQSRIRDLLKTPNGDSLLLQSGLDIASGASASSESQDFKALGYFSLVGLLRLHCMCGDYFTALKCIDDVKMLSNNDEELFCSSVTACHISLYYYAGFSFLMLRRYSDATACFSSILLFLSRTKQIHTRSYQWDNILKRQDQMIGLLALSVCISTPHYLDGILDEMLREKHAEYLARLRRGDVSAFEDLFTQSCPKFLSLYIPPLDAQAPAATNLHWEPLRAQQAAFVAEVRQQSRIPTIRSYLKLHSSISTEKLAAFLSVNVDELRALLLSYKHKTRSFERAAGKPISAGQWNDQVTGDMNFYVADEMVHVTETRSVQNYIAPLLEGIGKLNK